MLAILFIALAAFFSSVCDTLADHFDTSVFKWKDRRFWDKNTSWQYAPFLRFTRYRVDGWHLSKSLMVLSMALAVAFHTPLLKWYYEVLIAGVVWNGTFNLFYNTILRRK